MGGRGIVGNGERFESRRDILDSFISGSASRRGLCADVPSSESRFFYFIEDVMSDEEPVTFLPDTISFGSSWTNVPASKPPSPRPSSMS